MPTVLAMMAHPDDIEFTCAGTLILLKKAGWKVHLATMTPGDLGTVNLTRAQISRIRTAEAAASAKLLGASYTCLGLGDLTVVYGVEPKRRASVVIRETRPDLLILHSPECYMADHTESARIAREAAFASSVPNWRAKLNGRSARPCDHLPTVLYADPFENIDALGRRVRARFMVDITSVIEFKEKMLACHESQRSWMRQQHGEDEYLEMVRRNGADRAKDWKSPKVKYAEGFTQHLGHGFPKEDVLTSALGKGLVTKG